LVTELKQNKMRKAKGSGFKMRSGNTTSFKKMGSSSPVKNVDPSYYSNLIGNLQMTPTPASNAAQQAADRQAEIDAFNAAGGLSQAQNFDPTTGQFDFSSPGAQAALYNSLSNISVAPMNPNANIQAAYDLGLLPYELPGEEGSDNPNAGISSDLQEEVTDKLQKEEEDEYNPESYQGSLYDYSVKKRTPMSKKRSPKGKRGYKMKRK